MSSSDPHAPPRGEVRDIRATDELELADHAERLCAFFVDGIECLDDFVADTIVVGD